MLLVPQAAQSAMLEDTIIKRNNPPARRSVELENIRLPLEQHQSLLAKSALPDDFLKVGTPSALCVILVILVIRINNHLVTVMITSAQKEHTHYQERPHVLVAQQVCMKVISL